MSVQVNDEVNIVIGALWSDLTAFMKKWRAIFSQFPLIFIKDTDVKEDFQIPQGIDDKIYTNSDIDRITGTTSINFSGHSCRYFGYFVSSKKYVISIDDDYFPSQDPNNNIVNAVALHLTNLHMPATPFFFNIFYDPYFSRADFVPGYPFSLRSGVECALSCGLWLNIVDYDAPTHAVKPSEHNIRYVDTVLTVLQQVMMPVSGITLGFNRELLGHAVIPGLRLAGEGKCRWETMEDIWSGMCAKVVCDHLGLGVKSGLPCVQRGHGGENAMNSLKEKWEGVKLKEEVVPFFQ